MKDLKQLAEFPSSARDSREYACLRQIRGEGSVRTIRQLLAGEDEIQLAVRLALLALLVYWTFFLIRPFVPIIAWSVVLAVALFMLL